MESAMTQEPELPALPPMHCGTYTYVSTRGQQLKLGGANLYTEEQMRSYATAAVLAERERWENAMRQTWQMIDPIRPPGVPGSYARGTYQGIVDALTTLKANATIRTPPAKEPT
jgi:hypothetical protein